MKTPTYNSPVEAEDEERTIGALLAPDILVMLEEGPDAIAAETDELHAKDLADVAHALPRELVAPFLSALQHLSWLVKQALLLNCVAVSSLQYPKVSRVVQSKSKAMPDKPAGAFYY